MAVPQLLTTGDWLSIEPADPIVDYADILLLRRTITDLAIAGALSAIEQPTCDRLARLLVPYVNGLSVEALGAAFAIDPDDAVRVLRRVLLYVLYALPEASM